MQEMVPSALTEFLGRFGIELTWLGKGTAINGSFWGAPEAGIVGTRVYVRPDTPVHSFLHEVSHIVCMPADVREVHTGDAKSDDLEESAVCFLQIHRYLARNQRFEFDFFASQRIVQIDGHRLD